MLFLLLFLSSCRVQEERTFTVATWNTYCFFDGRSDGTEYDEFKEKSGYTQARYEARVKATAAYILRNLGDADVIVLEEVESPGVLMDLLEAGLSRYGYLWFGLAQNDAGQLSVGFISRIRPEDVLVHGTSSSRLILELDLNVDGRIVTIFGIHAKSRLGSGTEELRKEEFSLLRSLMDRADGSLALAVGDFNADPGVGEAGIAMERGGRSPSVPILTTGDGGATGPGIYYSVAADYMVDIGEGTYWYEGTWSFLDNILVDRGGFDGDGWEYSFAEIVRPGEAMDYMGHPMRYEASTEKGFSDHFALKATFKYN